MPNPTHRFFALVPAAGSGSRMGSESPKQYLSLAGRPLLFHTLSALAAHPDIERVFVVLSPGDEFWPEHDWSAIGGTLTPIFCGGATRAESVTNGLKAMAGQVSGEDWVLVHDAARPCLARRHLDALLSELAEDKVGGILAVPVADTLKRAASGQRIAETVSRDGLWQAQTPQMFRHGLLLSALEQAPVVTDEASAVEAMGLSPRLVAGDMTNLKVTYALDLHIAELILKDRENEHE
ncbi:MAG: 2-C-methyl-D-erythritol 4-phosphate cytidylyltransferase [Rhodocyclaceae bacterium]|nr:2-C-methyl-D-erythritol 4-phosphate cytidylyltransferase [Rhodocyclaceae bacterium]